MKQEFDANSAKLKELAKMVSDMRLAQQELDNEVREVMQLAGLPSQPPAEIEFDAEVNDVLFLEENIEQLDARLAAEVRRKPELLPQLSPLDMTIVLAAGLLAVLLDFLVVRVPKDVCYLQEYGQKGSSFTGWLRSLGVDDKGELSNPFLRWCEKACKVPYDQSINSGIRGFTPKTHRLLSLSHDPLFGLLFAILDIWNGTMTTFDTAGKLLVVKTVEASLAQKVLAPLVWIGHVVSDACTKMGVPIPGWGFLQLLQVGSLGEKGRTVADISRWMYLNGYDLRHLLTMSLPVAAMQIIIRGYAQLAELASPDQLSDLPRTIVGKEMDRLQFELKVHKMLFLADCLAVSGNAVRVRAYHGNPLAINIAETTDLLRESVTMAKAMARDKTSEMIVRNRTDIDVAWEKVRATKMGESSSGE